MKHIGILLAAGLGKRMNLLNEDKLLLPLKNTNAFRLNYEAFLNAECLDNVIIVYRDDDQQRKLKNEIKAVHEQTKLFFRPIFTSGGKERMDSVDMALKSCPSTTEFVYIHDCARPLIKSTTIKQLKKEIISEGAVTVARPTKDTIKSVSGYDPSKPKNTYFTTNLNRDELWIMETPQCAKKNWLERGIQEAQKRSLHVTDEVSLLELIGKKVTLMNPNYANPKLTTTQDLNYINFLLSHNDN